MALNAIKGDKAKFTKTDRTTVMDLLGAATVKELMEINGEIAAMIDEKADAEKTALKAKIDAMLADAGVDRAELFGKGGRLKGTKVPAKFRDPANPSQTWTGRGRQPKWLADAVAAGRKLADFEIKR